MNTRHCKSAGKSTGALRYGGKTIFAKDSNALFEGILEPEYEPEPIYVNSTYYYVA